jgi:hypothetical protein
MSSVHAISFCRATADASCRVMDDAASEQLLVANTTEQHAKSDFRRAAPKAADGMPIGGDGLSIAAGCYVGKRDR